MKNISLALLFCLFAGFAAGSPQDTVTNGGFEQWIMDGSNFSDPVGWNSLNALTSAYSIFTCFQDSATPHSGKYCVKLITKSIGGQVAPGILSTGPIHADGTIDHGVPFTSRPLYLNGWYQYAPVGADTASLNITLFSSDTMVGAGSINIMAAASSWTSFSIPVTYTSATTPDTVQLLFFSGTNNSPNIGSVILLDDLVYSDTAVAGISETEIYPVRLYPNPASKLVALDNTDMQAKTANIYAVDGRLVNAFALRDGTNQLNIADLAAGVYTIAATGSNGAAYRGKLLVE